MSQARLHGLLSGLKDFLSGIHSIVKTTIEENEAFIVNMNSEWQLYEKGELANGEEIRNFAPYASFTVMIKSAKSQPTDRVTLRDTGDFHKSFFIITDSEKFEITASDPKTKELYLHYSEHIFGLNYENIGELIEAFIRPALVDRLQKLANNG